MNRSPVRLILFLIPVFFLACNTACDAARPVNFGIYRADTGELVISQEHIRSYTSASHMFELSDKGIGRWNSFQHYTDVPKLNQSLYNKEFILKIDRQEIARGKFYSMVSSATYTGLALIDVLLPHDAEHNTLWLISDYPGYSLGDEYAGLDSALSGVFERLKLLRGN